MNFRDACAAARWGGQNLFFARDAPPVARAPENPSELDYPAGGGTTTVVVGPAGCGETTGTTTCGAGGLLALASTALDVTYEPPLIPNSAKMPPGIAVGNAGGFALRIIRNKPSAITKVKIRN